uniref:Transposase n=1 Tax=Myotis myotis TaxID=51298 RepID=A0A7J7ZXD9_MYOMY|nr:hypothetical protein mMyoMyo1_009678 [Myotis myotis]
MGKILKEGKWVPHQLNERQMENQKVISKMMLQQHKRKSFLHQIVTGNEKLIYFENPKCTKSWVDSGQPSTLTARPNRFGKKTMLCVWWDQEGVVYYELLKPGETINTDHYRQQISNLNYALIVERPEWVKRHGKVILLYDNAPPHTSKPVKDTLKDLAWEVLTHPPYSPDLLLQITTCSDRWHTHFLSSTSKHTKKWKIGSLNGLPQNKKSSIRTVSTNYLKDGGNV